MLSAGFLSTLIREYVLLLFHVSNMSLKLLTLQKQWHAEVWAPPLKMSVTANGFASNVCKIFILEFFLQKRFPSHWLKHKTKARFIDLSIYFFIQPTEHSKRFLQVSFRKFTESHSSGTLWVTSVSWPGLSRHMDWRSQGSSHWLSDW